MDEPRIKVHGSDVEVTIAANAAGLRDLAEQLLALAEPDVRSGYHLHLEVDTGLEAGSTSLILERDDNT